MLDNINIISLLEEIFKRVRNKRKLNLIKYNKRMLMRLNINKQEFEIYTKLKEFNNKYSTNIEDIDVKELNLNKRRIKNEGLKDLIEIKFKEINKLDLGDNKISEINVFEKATFSQLKELNLSGNELSDLNILEKVNFEQLEELNLS